MVNRKVRFFTDEGMVFIEERTAVDDSGGAHRRRWEVERVGLTHKDLKKLFNLYLGVHEFEESCHTNVCRICGKERFGFVHAVSLDPSKDAA